MDAFLSELLTDYPLLAPLLFVLARAVPIIVVPIPGIIVDFVGIAVFGWKLGLILALIGALGGSITAFFIARYFRDPVVRRFAALQRVHEWEDRYSEREKFWTLIAVRFVTAPFFDYVNYAAGFTKMSFGKFLLSTLIGVFPFAFALYYFGELALSQGPLYIIFLLIGLSMLSIVFGKEVRKRWRVRPKRFLCGGEKYVASGDKGENLSLPIFLGGLPEQIEIEGYSLHRKSEFHITLVAVGKIIEKHGIEASDFLQTVTDDFCAFVKEKSIDFVRYTGEFRFVSHEERRTLVAMCDISNLNSFIDLINRKYDLNIEYPPTHVTLYTLQPNLGIFLTDSKDLNERTRIIAAGKELEAALHLSSTQAGV